MDLPNLLQFTPHRLFARLVSFCIVCFGTVDTVVTSGLPVVDLIAIQASIYSPAAILSHYRLFGKTVTTYRTTADQLFDICVPYQHL